MAGSRTTATLLATVWLASPALADPKPPSDKDRQAAGDLVKKAIARSQAGDHSAAIEIYLQAYAIIPSSVLLSNIGSEFQQSAKPQDALRYFCMYLDKDPDGSNAPYAASQAKLLQIQLGNTDVDDHDVCAPAKPATVPADDEPASRKLRAPSDVAPVTEPEAAHAGFTTREYTGAALGIAGVVAIGIGVYAGVRAKDISDEITTQDPKMPWPNGIRGLQHSGQNYEYLQIGSLIAGGALAATGAILLLVGRPQGPEHPEHKPDRTAVRVVPTTNGLSVLGQF